MLTLIFLLLSKSSTLLLTKEMSVRVAILVILLGVISVVAEYTQPSIWPQPKSFVVGQSQTDVLPFQYVSKNGNVKTLSDAYDRNNKLIFNHAVDDAEHAKKAVYKVEVFVADNSEAYPQLTTDESYSLHIPSPTEFGPAVITLTAKTIYGALHGLQSLSQLVVYDFDADSYFIPSTPMQIDDAPRYPHRGMLLDTSRHFQPISFIQQTIDALSYAKYNVLHWHVVDTQSFPFESKTYEKLWNGAYTNAEKYSRADVKQLVEYGRSRGVKIMIEFDVPGHAASWCKGYPEICPSTTCLQPLDPSSNLTFPLITSLLAECTGSDVSTPTVYQHDLKKATAGRASVAAPSAAPLTKAAKTTILPASAAAKAATVARAELVQQKKEQESLFPYSLLHLGGDEVSYTCWEQSPQVLAWESANGIAGSEGTYEYFVDRVAAITRDQQRTPVQWVEVFEHFGSNLDQNTVVHVWKEKSTLDGVLTAGYNALLSNQDFWYLDHLSVTWDQMYLNEPTAGLSATSDPALILGGESCMWAETVDPSDLHNTVWPRAAAVAEVLWTPLEVIYPNGLAAGTDLASVENRLETFRCLLTRRGISAAPVTNTQARYQPKEPNSCFVQRRRL